MSAVFVRAIDDIKGIWIDEAGRERIYALPKRERPLCGAQTRSGAPCRRRAMRNRRRCKFHGGAATGPKTEAGRQRIAEAQRARWQRIREQSNSTKGTGEC